MSLWLPTNRFLRKSKYHRTAPRVWLFRILVNHRITRSGRRIIPRCWQQMTNPFLTAAESRKRLNKRESRPRKAQNFQKTRITPIFPPPQRKQRPQPPQRIQTFTLMPSPSLMLKLMPPKPLMPPKLHHRGLPLPLPAAARPNNAAASPLASPVAAQAEETQVISPLHQDSPATITTTATALPLHRPTTPTATPTTTYTIIWAAMSSITSPSLASASSLPTSLSNASSSRAA